MEEQGQEKEPWNYQNDGLHIGFRIGMCILYAITNRINRKIICETEEDGQKSHYTTLDINALART